MKLEYASTPKFTMQVNSKKMGSFSLKNPSKQDQNLDASTTKNYEKAPSP